MGFASKWVMNWLGIEVGPQVTPNGFPARLSFLWANGFRFAGWVPGICRAVRTEKTFGLADAQR